MERKTCQVCGHKGNDVITTLEHVGGLGFTPSVHCLDRVACWARWDRQNEVEGSKHERG